MKEIFENTIEWDQTCWRYFKIERLISCLNEGTLYFAAANQFEDEWEGATGIYSKDIFEMKPIRDTLMFHDAFKELQRLTKINCWHKSNEESYAMWKLYGFDKKGVAITTTPRLMRSAIKPYRIKPNYGEEDLFIGNVNYIDLEAGFEEDSMLERFFYKHIVFSSEQEIRLAISLRLAEEYGVLVPDEGIRVKVDFSQLIDNIIVGPRVNEGDRTMLIEVVKQMGLESKLRESCLSKRPWFV